MSLSKQPKRRKILHESIFFCSKLTIIDDYTMQAEDVKRKGCLDFEHVQKIKQVSF
jgi:hypothetical protein